MILKKSASSNLVFIVFALMLHAFCAALAVGGMMRVYNLTIAYEHSRPEYVVGRVLSLFEENRYPELMHRGNINLSKFETPENFISAAKKSYDGNQFSISHQKENVWQIFCGKTPAAMVFMRCEEGSAPGLEQWNVDRLELLLPAPQNYTIKAPFSARIAINGIEAHEDIAANSIGDENSFGQLPDALALEATKVYRLDGLFSPPEVTATGAGNLPGAVSRFQNSFAVGLYPGDSVVATLSQFGEQAACAYAKFITEDATLDEVLPYFLPDSHYYSHLKQFYNGWYNIHDQHAFKNAKFSNWNAYSDRHVSCDISFDYWIKMGKREYTYPSNYTMYFVLSRDGWRVANLVVL